MRLSFHLGTVGKASSFRFKFHAWKQTISTRISCKLTSMPVREETRKKFDIVFEIWARAVYWLIKCAKCKQLLFPLLTTTPPPKKKKNESGFWVSEKEELSRQTHWGEGRSSFGAFHFRYGNCRGNSGIFAKAVGMGMGVGIGLGLAGGYGGCCGYGKYKTV